MTEAAPELDLSNRPHANHFPRVVDESFADPRAASSCSWWQFRILRANIANLLRCGYRALDSHRFLIQEFLSLAIADSGPNRALLCWMGGLDRLPISDDSRLPCFNTPQSNAGPRTRGEMLNAPASDAVSHFKATP